MPLPQNELRPRLGSVAAKLPCNPPPDPVEYVPQQIRCPRLFVR